MDQTNGQQMNSPFDNSGNTNNSTNNTNNNTNNNGNNDGSDNGYHLWNQDYLSPGHPQVSLDSQMNLQNNHIQQQKNEKQHTPTFIFTNPWDNNEKIPQQNLQYSQNYETYGMSNEDFEAFKRRKSSLVIPPARAPAPNPFHYDKYPLYSNINNNNINNSHRPSLGSSSSSLAPMNLQMSNPSLYQQQAQQAQDLFEKQQAQQQLLSSRFLPSFYNAHNQDAQRRQSLAAPYYSQTYQSNPSVAGSKANSITPSNAIPGSNSTNNYSTNAPNMTSLPAILPYRRLSAYPSSTAHLLHPSNLRMAATDADLLQQHLYPRPQSQYTVPSLQKCSSKSDLQPIVNPTPKFRRASLHSKTISPLVGLTKNLITTYQLCSSDFTYKTSKNPKRVLTKPNEAKLNNGYDNVNSDYILYVNDVLGTEQSRKYLVLDILGQGTFGQVVKCQNLLNKEIIAVKVIKSKSEYLNQSITEAKILELINTKIDPNNVHHFLRMQDSFIHRNHLCLVFELLSNNLYELLRQNQYHGLSIQLIKIFTKQLLDSLCILKDNKLIHCDLKPENILLCSPDKPDIKIIDFGSSCEETRTVYTYIQSRFYRAPEIILGIPYSTSIDMWSLGCIVAELFLGIPIFPGSSEFNQLTRIITTLGYPPNWMLEMGKNTSKFMKKSEECDQSMKYKLKTIDEFNCDFEKANEQPGKKYFKWDKLNDIIRNYRIPKTIQNSNDLVQQEMNHRECLIHFLSGILNLNPLERWTPQQASLHPFITNQPFTGEWYPPGSFNRNLDDRTSQFNNLKIEEQ
ncbi:hypothetical protein KAFR_0F01940 [Kazachstania africana CBS 2517]|uniref:Protein kinase domain-containing protein n=1 Tax=Kazachstania africana (strain ATCC 22294 / BCRC 22015 / CBS 2517 / CECT 1963 / NBRC 1671 / NRRL Y-8276) TaxID=1071382 RepID=H2AWP1_KAZAF|nr:hypothetical protein KAFR_0F01940 [Kazachstania africana CBS 2517]CCF58791.1 hypothetical protein KAFR_0F01940 [Kazachstania africana CBS 2517]